MYFPITIPIYPYSYPYPYPYPYVYACPYPYFYPDTYAYPDPYAYPYPYPCPYPHPYLCPHPHICISYSIHIISYCIPFPPIPRSVSVVGSPARASGGGGIGRARCSGSMAARGTLAIGLLGVFLALWLWGSLRGMRNDERGKRNGECGLRKAECGTRIEEY